MLETAVALIFGHLAADFLLQTDAMVRDKRRPGILLAHIAIVAAASWVALGVAPAPALIATIAGSHLIIDAIKQRWGGPGLEPFLLDQAAHGGMIALGAALWPGAYASGVWALPAVAARLPWIAGLPEMLVIGSGVIATVWAGGYAVGALMRSLSPPSAPPPEEDRSLPQGGRMIGRLERLLILILVLMGEPGGIGFLITAKSILRFGEVSRDGAGSDEGRRVSEYVIIGTLASFAWALATAMLTLAGRSALDAP